MPIELRTKSVEIFHLHPLAAKRFVASFVQEGLILNIKWVMLLVLAVVIVFAITGPVRRFVRQDSCLDWGGVWHAEGDSCYKGKL